MCPLTIRPMFVTNILLWWTLDSVPLPTVIKPKVVKKDLQWRCERRAQVESYVVTSVKPKSELDLQCNILTLVERQFRSKSQAVVTKGVSWGRDPKFHCVQNNLF